MRVFEPGVATFFNALAEDNSRAWFTAHRDEYEQAVRIPIERLLAEAEPVYGPGRVMRPNRDVRFSPNKAPYKLNGAMWAGTVGGVYLHVDAHGIELGGGLYDPTREQLARGRDAIATKERAARALATTVADLESAGYEMAGPHLKTAPRGYPLGHPRIDLLRLTHYAALRHLPLDGDHDRILESWERVRPLIDWAGTHVGPALTAR